MTGTTFLGTQAYDLLDWLNGDLEARAPEALARVQELARQAMAGGSGQALVEVQDAGAVIHRLADAVSRPVPAAFSGGIAAQVIELGDFDPLRHPRGAHGKFVKSGTSAPAAQGGGFAHAIAAQMAEKPSYGGFTQALGPAMARMNGGTAPHVASPQMRSPAADLDKIVGGLQQKFGTGASSIAEQVVGKKELAELETQMRSEIKRSREQMEQMEHSTHEGHKAKMVLELIGVAAGAALTFGLGGGVLSLAVIGPFILRTLVEKSPEIVRAIAEYQVVGKGHGRSFMAHPAKKTVLGAKVAAVKTAHAVRQVPAKVPALAKGQSKTVGMAGDAPGVAAKAAQFVADLLVQGGLDPATASEFATAGLKSYIARNWDLLNRAGASPGQMVQNLA